nr:transposase family protein [Microcystis aeruginosa]
MVTVLKAEKVWQKKTGRPSKLSTEDQLLITLEYWREYRTYFHLGNSWGVNESTAYRIVRKVENILIKSGLFNLPGKKALLESNKYLSKINYTFRSSFCLLPIASCLSSLGNLFCMTT